MTRAVSLAWLACLAPAFAHASDDDAKGIPVAKIGGRIVISAETIEVKERIRKVLKLLTRQLEILKMRERINSQIKEEMGKNQREYVLRQQLKAIKEELGEDDGDQGDLDGL